MSQINISQISSDGLQWEIKKTGKMKVSVRIYASKELLDKMNKDRTLQQAIEVAQLNGIKKFAVVLPDGHQGYGFPIGGVAATSIDENGVISPGGVGYDINCGVRVIRTNLNVKDNVPIKQLINRMFELVPSGLGSKGKIRVSYKELDEVLKLGAKWGVENNYGWERDLEYIEENGQMPNADPSVVSSKAKQRGLPQIGSLGSGNHFLEIQKVDKIYQPEIAKKWGIYEEGQITIMIHTGSRGFGHQVCSDYLRIMERAMPKYNIRPPNRELAAVPINSKEGQDYLKAMACSINYAFNNRQLITHWTREAFESVLRTSAEDLDLNIIYGVAHNIAKIEEHIIDGKKMKVCVHRKGATRAFPPKHPALPSAYRSTGQPVLLPGSMGSASYLLVGTPKSMELTFGSTAHGAGRNMSRAQAKRTFWGENVERDMLKSGTYVKAQSKVVLSEEAPLAYKNIDKVADVSHKVGIATKVVRLVPIGVTKG
ncbi:MAG: RtcB family protein [Candidatus Helarchaeota archaeon]